MSLTIKATEKKKIRLVGLSIDLPDILVRYKPYPSYDGKMFEADIKYFEKEESWKEDSESNSTNLQIMIQDLEGKWFFVNSILNQKLKEGEEQNHATFHKYLKEVFEGFGYTCIINL